jgi:hypothetical protein
MFKRCSLGIAAALLIAPAVPAHAVTVSISPADTAVTIGDNVTVRVVIDAVPDLKGAELIHGYTSGKMQFLSALAGDAIAGGPYVDFVIPDVTAPPDSVWYNTARLVGTGSGPGIIVFYTFETLLEGDANIACLFADLRDSQNNQSLPECHGGVIHILGPVPARAASWGRVKQIYR